MFNWIKKLLAKSGRGTTSCWKCEKRFLSGMPTVAVGDAVTAAVSQLPYRCKVCGTNFCVDCMVEIAMAEGKKCPSCGKPVGW